MNFTEYQELAARTLIDQRETPLDEAQTMIAWNVIGLAGEAGEVCELIKKGVFHDHGVDRSSLAKELGDVLWYVAALATEYGLSLHDIAEANIEKLRTRYPDGYSKAANQAKADEVVE